MAAPGSDGEQGMRTKAVLITGAAGSLGRELAHRLSRSGHRVRALDLPQCDFTPLVGLPGVETQKGDVADLDGLRRAVEGIDAVVHLAALLPPASERDRDVTMAVNAGGTENLVRALELESPNARLVLSSSVCVYGETAADDAPIRTSHPLCALDHYAESKIAAEAVVLGAGLLTTILRISGISVAAFLEPPAVWPFTREQRIEFVCRDDVVAALSACVDAPGARGKVFHVAGGPTWQMMGGEYVTRFSEVMGIESQEATYRIHPGYFDWYDTVESQAILKYQRTSHAHFLELLGRAIEEAMAD
jgi:nucleoside-diphosphate-sugar epimerase